MTEAERAVYRSHNPNLYNSDYVYLDEQNRSGQGMSFGYCGSFHTFFRIEMISESHLRSGALSKATWSSGRAISPFTS